LKNKKTHSFTRKKEAKQLVGEGGCKKKGENATKKNFRGYPSKVKLR